MKRLKERFIKRLLVEAKYHTRLLLLDRRGALLQKWLDRDTRTLFPRWGVTERGALLENPEMFFQFVVDAKFAQMWRENLTRQEAEQFQSMIADFLADVQSQLEIEEFVAITSQCFWIVPSSAGFSAIREHIAKALMGWPETAPKLGADLDDVAVVWELRGAPGRVNIQAGPVQSEEFAKWFKSVQQDEKAPARFFPQRGMLVQTTIVREQVTASHGPAVLKELLDWSDQAVVAFAELVGQEV